MKKLYTLLMAFCLVSAVSAQVDLTLSVDMNNETVSAEGVHVAGSFQGWAADGTPMSDDDLDGIYEVTLSIEAGDYEFKFINGNDWPFEETVPDACRADLTGNTNRSVSVAEATTYAVCYGSCAPCGMSTVLLRVDMSQEEAIAPQGVHVGGNFQGWDPSTTVLSDADGDLIYTLAYSYDPTMLEADGGDLLYKFINGNDWVFPTEDIDPACGDGTGNRLIEAIETNAVTAALCFNSCTSCVAPTEITLRVDMSLQIVSPNGVHVAGDFQGWDADGTPMSDDDADGIYEVTVAVALGSYEYKFINGNDWEGLDNDNESVPADCNTNGNRLLVVEAAQTITYCYNQCSEACENDPDPADVTFNVEMNELEVSDDGVWLIGSYTDPQWQGGATMMMDDDDDGVYTATVNISGSADFQYKFTNGDPYLGGTVDATVEEMYDFETNGCGVANGVGGFNRTHTRSGEAEELDVVCYDSCVACGNGIEDGLNVDFVVYPNPTNGVLNINSDDFNGLTEINLFNAQGKLVLSEVIIFSAGQTTVIDVNEFPNGVYAITLLSGDSVSTHMIIKK
ncbi:MAG: hypothetical protein ACJAU0_001261 [Flavobacteriales bacterium]|jgi:hypothetical protein